MKKEDSSRLRTLCFFISHGTVVACVVLLISRYGDKRHQLAFCVVRESHASRCLKMSARAGVFH